MIAEALNIPKPVVVRILKRIWDRKLYARFVPHLLTPEQREGRDTSCQDIIAMADANFLTKLLRKMKPGVLPMTPKLSDRVLNGFVRHTLGRRNWRFHIGTMLIIFFDSQGVVHKEFVPKRKTVCAECSEGVMDRVLKRVQRVRPAAFCYRDCFLLRDNAPANQAASVGQFETPKNVTTLNHPPYSPDLSPPGYYILFPKLKMKLIGLHFAVVAEIQ